MDPVVHFDLPYDDRERISTFYSQVFGWELQQLGPEMGNYVVATTAKPGRPAPPDAVPGAIGGGFFPRSKDMPAQHPSVVVAVQDIRASMRKIATAGGKVLGEPMTIPTVGDYVAFFDTEGNRLSILQPLPMGQ